MGLNTADPSGVFLSVCLTLLFLAVSFAYFMVLAPADANEAVEARSVSAAARGEEELEEADEEDEEGANGGKVEAAVGVHMPSPRHPPLVPELQPADQAHWGHASPSSRAGEREKWRAEVVTKGSSALTFPHAILGLSFSVVSLAGSLFLAQWISPFMFFSLELRLLVSVLLLFLGVNFLLTIFFFALVLDRGPQPEALSAALLPRLLRLLFTKRRAHRHEAGSSSPPPPTSSTLPGKQRESNTGGVPSRSVSPFKPFQPSPLSLPALTPEDLVTLEAASPDYPGGLSGVPPPVPAKRSNRSRHRRTPLTLGDTCFCFLVGVCSLLNCGHFSLITFRDCGVRGQMAQRVSLLAALVSIPLSLLKGALLTGIAFVLFSKLTQWNIPLMLGLLGGLCCLLSGLLETAVLLRLTLTLLFPKSPRCQSGQLVPPAAAGQRRNSATSFSSLRIKPIEVVLSTLFFSASLLFFVLEITHLHTPSLLISFTVSLVSFLLWFNSLLPGLSSSRYLHLSRYFLTLFSEVWYYSMIACLILVVGAYHLDHACTWRYFLVGVAAILFLASALSAYASSISLEEVWRPSLICLLVVLVVWLLPLYLTNPELTWLFVRDMATTVVVTTAFWLGLSAWINLSRRFASKRPSQVSADIV